MANPKLDPPPSPSYYYPIPPDSHPQPQTYIVLPLYIPASVRRQWRGRLICAATLLVLAVALFFLWPSDPDLEVVRIRLGRAHIRTVPHITIDIAMELTVKVRNPDLYSMDYSSLLVSIGYRGKKLGFVTSDHGRVNSRASSYVNATLELDGVEVLSDVILLLEDLARGFIPFDTVTEFTGQLGLFFFKIPLKAKVSCEVYINTRNQTIVRQNCYPA